MAGIYKGHKINFVNLKFDQADITPQKIKGAIFSLLGEDLTGKSFLDLYAGSGQIGLEALSRGANLVIFNEKDFKRYQFIKKEVKEFFTSAPALFFKQDSLKTLEKLSFQNIKLDFIFLDPPYEKESQDFNLYQKLLVKINQGHMLNEKGVVLIQHFKKNEPITQIGNLKILKTKQYGTSCLTSYS